MQSNFYKIFYHPLNFITVYIFLKVTEAMSKNRPFYSCVITFYNLVVGKYYNAVPKQYLSFFT